MVKEGGGKGKEKKKGPVALNRMSVEQVKRLEEELRESKTALNNLLTLIEAARGGSGGATTEEGWKVQMAALLALCRSCSRLMETGDLIPPGCSKSKETAKGVNRKELKESKDKLAVWMAATYKEIVKVALEFVEGKNVKGQLVGMRAVMGLVAREAETAAEMGCPAQVWTDGLFTALISALLESTHTSQQVLRSFSERYLEVYGDVRYYTWRAVAWFAGKKLVKEEGATGLVERGATMARNAYDLMCLCKIPPTEERTEGKGASKKVVHVVNIEHLVAGPSRRRAVHEEREGAQPSSMELANADRTTSAAANVAATSGKKRGKGVHVDLANKGVYAKAFSDAWIALMRVELPADVIKSVLTKLHTDLLPHMTQPLLLADVLTACYERGGMLAVLSLHGLFALIQVLALSLSDAVFTRLGASPSLQWR